MFIKSSINKLTKIDFLGELGVFLKKLQAELTKEVAKLQQQEEDDIAKRMKKVEQDTTIIIPTDTSIDKGLDHLLEAAIEAEGGANISMEMETGIETDTTTTDNGSRKSTREKKGIDRFSPSGEEHDGENISKQQKIKKNHAHEKIKKHIWYSTPIKNETEMKKQQKVLKSKDLIEETNDEERKVSYQQQTQKFSHIIFGDNTHNIFFIEKKQVEVTDKDGHITKQDHCFELLAANEVSKLLFKHHHPSPSASKMSKEALIQQALEEKSHLCTIKKTNVDMIEGENVGVFLKPGKKVNPGK